MYNVKRAQYQYPPLTKQTPKVSSLSKSGGDTPCVNPIQGGDAKGALFQELQFTPVDFFEDDSAACMWVGVQRARAMAISRATARGRGRARTREGRG